MAIKKNFVAQHYLVGDNFGPEGKTHSHTYKIEIRLSSTKLNKLGFVFDIAKLSDELERQIEYFSDKTLNELEEFAGQNPSLENFCCIFYGKFIKQLSAAAFDNMTIILWEDENTWASYTPEL